MEAAKGHRLRVPEDIAVVGFDDIPAAKRIALQLTTGGSTHCEKGPLGRLVVAQG
jgi:DNA-binding LacI/PurR family transcriptional regulator